MTLRWKLVDTETQVEWVMPLNPNAMTAPPLTKTLVTGANPHRVGGVSLAAMRTSVPAQDWQWSGVIRTKEHHDQLAAWAALDHIIRVHDHLNRIFEVVIVSFEPTDKQSRIEWRMTYVMKTLALRRIA